MLYVDYIYYTQSFADTLVPTKEFDSLCRKAQNYLDYITSHKIDKNNVSDEVKTAICTVVNELYDLHQSRSKIPQGIKSENTDGYSVTYADYDFNKIKADEKRLMHDIFVEQLCDTGLLYRGCDSAY